MNSFEINVFTFGFYLRNTYYLNYYILFFIFHHWKIHEARDMDGTSAVISQLSQQYLENSGLSFVEWIHEWVIWGITGEYWKASLNDLWERRWRENYSKVSSRISWDDSGVINRMGKKRGSIKIENRIEKK